MPQRDWKCSVGYTSCCPLRGRLPATRSGGGGDVTVDVTYTVRLRHTEVEARSPATHEVEARSVEYVDVYPRHLNITFYDHTNCNQLVLRVMSNSPKSSKFSKLKISRHFLKFLDVRVHFSTFLDIISEHFSTRCNYTKNVEVPAGGEL